MLDKYIEQVLLKDMSKALDAVGPEAFLELIYETFIRAKVDLEDSNPELAALHGIHAEAIEIMTSALEGIEGDLSEAISQETRVAHDTIETA